MTPMASWNPSIFSDTTSGYVMALDELCIIGGYPDGMLRPSNYLTRAELSAIVLRIMNVKNGKPAEAVSAALDASGSESGLTDGSAGTGDSSEFEDIISNDGGSGDTGKPEPGVDDDVPGWGALH